MLLNNAREGKKKPLIIAIVPINSPKRSFKEVKNH